MVEGNLELIHPPAYPPCTFNYGPITPHLPNQGSCSPHVGMEGG